MSLGFWELPGPSTFAAEIERLVQGGESAAVVLPPGTPAGLGSLLGARARAEGRYWYSLSPGNAQPIAALADLIALPPPCGAQAPRELARALCATAVWIEGFSEERARPWVELLTDFATAARSEPAGAAGSLVLVLDPVTAVRCEIGLRVLKWRGRVRREDALIHLADRSGNGNGSVEQQLRLAIAVELAGWDLELARRLAERSLPELLRPARILREEVQARDWRKPAPKDRWAAGWSDHWRGSRFDHPAALALEGKDPELAQRVWKAELAVLFPLIEERRCALLPQLRPFLKAPIDTPTGRIETIEDLEIGQIWHQVRHSKLSAATKTRVMGLANMRRALAHVEPIDPGDLCHAGMVDEAVLVAA
ncbi:MAG TPA: hypothetical protein DFS52_22970 [Myxococcales bacterium]|jgi:hypothetical protein|nr:hypothetical protein [Myxococcales bacterium]